MLLMGEWMTFALGVLAGWVLRVMWQWIRSRFAFSFHPDPISDATRREWRRERKHGH